jgi:hypothetical protein
MGRNYCNFLNVLEYPFQICPGFGSAFLRQKKAMSSGGI